MRILFMGTPEFAVPSLTALVQCGFDTREQLSVCGVAVVVLHKCPLASADT